VVNLVSSANHSYFKFTEKFSEHLSSALFPNKIVTTLLGWAEVVPLPSKIVPFIAEQRNAIKTSSSTFAVPNFFLTQSKLVETSLDLKKKLTSSTPLSFGEVVENVKKVFFAFLSSIISFFKLPGSLDKTKVIDLSKISKQLPDVLAKGGTLLSLGLDSMKTVDSAWALKKQLSSANGHFSSGVKKSILKLGTGSLSVVSDGLSTASLFLGWYADPIVAATVTTISVGITLAGKIASFNKLFWNGESKARDAAYASLPA
jgi:hypothetical protein